MSAPSSRKPSSPCTKVCVLDEPSGLCVGCGRTGDEIALWGSMSDVERRAVMAELEARLRANALWPAKAPARR
ncbi:DUF1289 domain-containing protein [uncultured Methylobacterium sp.]|uniref:DUF1289 domain-containing protein n=1 Tax=uncultured Methylobacterium sp. TaxID=157278 RepID=UPI0035CB68AA